MSVDLSSQSEDGKKYILWWKSSSWRISPVVFDAVRKRARLLSLLCVKIIQRRHILKRSYSLGFKVCRADIIIFMCINSISLWWQQSWVLKLNGTGVWIGSLARSVVRVIIFCVVHFQNWRLKHSSLIALLEYSRHRKVKAALAERARGHLVKNVLGRIFPWWLAKVWTVFSPVVVFLPETSLIKDSVYVLCISLLGTGIQHLTG